MGRMGSTGRVVSVNTGRVVETDWAAKSGSTAIEKRPAGGPIAVSVLGLTGDEHADTDHHGGVYQAVYAYAREDLDWWAARLGRELRDGMFGENLTVSGIDVNGAPLGQHWRVGTTLLRITGPRIPCVVFRGWMGEPGWVKRFTEAERPGAHFQVLEEGEIGPGDGIEIVHTPDERISVAESFRARQHGDRDVLRRIVELPDHAPKWDRILKELPGT